MATARLQRFRLDGIRDTGIEIGRGPYALVKELDFRGLKCVGKEIFSLLYEEAAPRERADMLRRFEEECELLGRLHHPNIVQFLGVHVGTSSGLPALVMEYLPTTLSGCVDRHGILPAEISLGILRDVALGLRYLHEHSPPIIHRDLSANKVLLTTNMSAKISYLGVWRIHVPMVDAVFLGTPSYMPPETMVARPKYTSKVDIFSMGVLIVHVLSGDWPIPSKEFTMDPLDPDNIRTVSEFDRRRSTIAKIEDRHPLLGLIRQCLSDIPSRRPDAVEVVRQVRVACSRVPPFPENRLELLHQVQSLRAELQQCSRPHQTEQDLQTQLQQSRQSEQDLQTQLQRSRQTEQVLQTQLQQSRQSELVLQRHATKAMQDLQIQVQSHSTREIEFWNVPRTDVRIVSEIDRGGWGTVLKGTFQGRAVAVKQLHRSILSKDNVLRLRREVRMMAQIRHPNLLLFIAAVFDDEVERLQSPPLIVMELLDTDLRKAYETKLILSRDRIPIFRDVAFALNYLHSCHEPIIHRDLSAPNVLLEALANNRWKAKISDFGSANLVKLAQTAAEGAIIYSAPETLPDEIRDPRVPTEQTPKIDVYSYGVLLCEVITCRLPTQFSQMKAEVKQSWPFMHSLITSCTNRFPTNRPTMAKVLGELQKLP